MANPKKVAQVERIEGWLRNANAQILVDYRGLSVREISDLRHRLRSAGAELHVVKNTLYRRAYGDRMPEALRPHMEGMTAVAFVMGDETQSAKALTEFIKQARKAEIKTLVIRDKVYPAEAVETLAKMPPREVMLAQLLGTLQSPISGLVGTLSELIGQFVRTLQAVADKKAETQA